MLLVFAVFAIVFCVVAAVLSMLGAGSAQTRQVVARLEALAFERGTSDDKLIDVRRRDLLSALPWLNRLLLRLDASARLHLVLHQAGLNWTVGRVVLLSVAAFVLAAYLAHLRTGAALLATLLGICAGAMPGVYVVLCRAKRFGMFEARLPEALDLMVGALRAGHSLNSVFGLVGKEAPEPIASEFRQCFDEQNFGLEFRTALLNLVARVPIHDMRIAATAMLVQKETGGNLAQVLDGVAQVIRERYRVKRQVRIHTAQGRLTGWILGVLPVVLGVALYLAYPDHMSVLWTTPVGLKLLYAGAGLTLLGALIIRSIVRIRV